MTFPIDISSGSFELLELDRLDTAFAVSAQRDAEMRRRFMTLFVDVSNVRAYGSSGYVCKAFNSLGEEFAVKRLRPERSRTPLPGEEAARATEGQLAAFQEEYKSQLQLSHMKGFPRLYGLGYAGDDPVIIMEWVEGLTLEAARSQLPTKNGTADATVVTHFAKNLFAILDGLDHLSERPVHRDISPSNIMIRTRDRSLAEQIEALDFDLCLIDFGSATVMDADDARFTLLTDVWRNGTPEYAPPEMLTHDVPNIEDLRQSPSIDVYAACSVLYELLAGHTPFRVGEQRSRSPYRVKTETEPEPLPESFGALGEAIMGGIQQEQNQRYTPLQILALCDRFLGIESPAAAAFAGESEQIPPTEDFETAHLHMAGAARPAQGADAQPVGEGQPVGEAQPAVVAQEGHAQPKSISRRAFIVGAAGFAGVAAIGGVTLWVRSKDSATGEGQSSAAASAASGTAPYEGGTLLLAQDSQSMLWGYVNSQRQWVIEPTFKTTPGFFSEGLAFAQDPETNLFGFIDYEGTWIIAPQFATAGTFYEDELAPAQEASGTGKLGWIDKTGAWVVEPFCESGGAFREGLAAFSPDHVTSNNSLGYGYIDTTGAVVIDPQFFDAKAFTDSGLAAAAAHVAQWGWIDRTGAWVISPEYGKAGSFFEGLASAMDPITELWGYVDEDGSLAIPAQFADARRFSAGMAAAKDAESGQWGCIDKTGAWHVQPSFSMVGDFSHGLAPAQDIATALYGYIDDQGQWVIPPSFSAVGLPAVE